MNQLVVGIAGRRHAGKDTAAQGLLELGFENEKFAGGLKEMLRAFLRYCRCPEDIIERMLEGDLKEEPSKYFGGRTTRFVMQTLGTEWGRNLIGERLWIDGFDFHIEGKSLVAVTDVRFPNEPEHIRRELGGMTIKVIDPNRSPLVGDEHPSEALVDLLTVDFVVENDKTLDVEFFKERVRAIVRGRLSQPNRRHQTVG